MSFQNLQTRNSFKSILYFQENIQLANTGTGKLSLPNSVKDILDPNPLQTFSSTLFRCALLRYRIQVHWGSTTSHNFFEKIWFSPHADKNIKLNCIVLIIKMLNIYVQQVTSDLLAACGNLWKPKVVARSLAGWLSGLADNCNRLCNKDF